MFALPWFGAPLAAASLAVATPDAPFAPTDNLARPDLLPVLRSVRVASQSSYDRTGGNDDGFSGKYSFIRKEGDALVIAELTGPGVVQRFHTPTPTDLPIEFYFDGEARPRIRSGFRDLFLGAVPGFPEPLVGHGVGGFYSYVPIPYSRSLKVVYRGPVMQFFQLNYASLPAGAAVESFQPSWVTSDAAAVAAARDILLAPGADISGRLLPGGKPVVARARRTLAPGRRVTLFEAKRGGRILGIRLSPASAFAGKDRALVLRIAFDGARQPAVLCPVGDFFGYSWGEPAMRSAFVGTRGDTAYAYLPMPFDRSARVEVVSDRTDGPPVEFDAEVVHADLPRRPDEGRFYAVWRREDPTTTGKPFTFVEARGHGHIVGIAQQAQGMEPGSTPFFEGDDQATIDGTLTIHGTGSEDYYNGGWYDVPGRWDGRRSLPLSGCLDYKKHLGRSAGFRFMVPDPIVYHDSILQTIEHAPERNDIPTDYVGVTYLYADRPPAGAGELPPAPQRAVTDPRRVVIAAGWNVPVQAFSLQNATIGKRVERIGTQEERLLSMQAEGGDVFGEHFLELLCDVPAAGTYRLTAQAVAGPDQGTVQMFRDESPVGPKADLYAREGRAMRRIDLGALALASGRNPVMLKLSPSVAAQKRFGLDLVTLILERQD